MIWTDAPWAVMSRGRAQVGSELGELGEPAAERRHV